MGTALLACPALPAGQARIDRDPIAEPHSGHPGTGLDHLARDLVTQDQRLAHREIAHAAVEVVVQV
jgi:hypothetical protein